MLYKWWQGQPQLKKNETRTDNASDVIRRLQPNLEQVEGITLYMQPVQDLTVEDRVSRTQFQYSLEDPDPKELATWAPKFIASLQDLKELRDVASDAQDQGLQVKLNIDRDTASRLGITPTDIDNALYDAFGQRQISTMYTQLNQYHVIIEAKEQFRTRPKSLTDIYIHPASGTAPVPLSQIGDLEQTTAPLTINHQGQFSTVTVSFNLAPDASLGEAVKEINAAKDKLDMPASVSGSFQGTAAAFQASLANEPLLILAALITVYIVLGVLYESYIHPITILSTLPSAGVGACLALLLCHEELSVIALIGIILLIGIVKKNAIMMIDFALEAEREGGKPPEDAIFEACLLRLRPILMTTMAALLAGVPLALGTGTGSELRRPLGITIIGGLIFSQVLTLYTTPVIYLYFDRLATRLGSKRRREARGEAEGPIPAGGEGPTPHPA
jgi:multidrug efflux pump